MSMRTVTFQTDVPELTRYQYADLFWLSLGYQFYNTLEVLQDKGLVVWDGPERVKLTAMGHKTLATNTLLFLKD